MNVLLFAKSADLPEARIAEFRTSSVLRLKDKKILRDHAYVSVRTLIGVEHDPCSPSFDCVRLNLAQLLAAGITELRLEVEV